MVLGTVGPGRAPLEYGRMAAAGPPEPKVQRAVESRLRERLRDLTHALERSEVEVVAQLQDEGASPSVAARPRLLAACERDLQEHCERVVTDLVAFRAEAQAAPEWFQDCIDAHVDTATSEVTRWLAEHLCAGVAGKRSEARRLANVSSRIKTESRDRLALGGAAADTAREAADDLDDRLPLRRRRAFDRDLPVLLQSAASAGEPLALVMIDLDHFKRVNDEHGHPAGDEVLLEVSRLLVRRLSHKGTAYRYGGEEIALLLPAYSLEEAIGLAERVRKDVAAAIVGAKRLTLTASCGVAVFPDQASDALGLLASADRALYEAKHAGRNCVRAPSPSPAAE